MIKVDGLVLPVMMYGPESPPFCPNIRVLAGFESIVPAITSAVLNRIGTVANMTKSATATYNRMVLPVQNEFTLRIIELAAFIAARKVQTREYVSAHAAVVPAATEAVRIAIALMVQDHSELQQFLAPTEINQIKANISAWSNYSRDMQSMLGALGVISTETNTRNPHPTKESNMNIPTTFSLGQNQQGQLVVVLPDGNVIPYVQAVFNPSGAQVQLNVAYQMTPQAAAYVQNCLLQMMQQAQMMPQQQMMRHPQQAMMPTVGLVSSTPTLAQTAINAFASGVGAVQDTSERYSHHAYQPVNQPAMETQAQPEATVVYKPKSRLETYIEMTDQTLFDLRQGATEEVSPLIMGRGNPSLFPMAYDNTLEGIAEFRKTEPEHMKSEYALSVDEAIQLAMSSRSDETVNFEFFKVLTGQVVQPEDGPAYATMEQLFETKNPIKTLAQLLANESPDGEVEDFNRKAMERAASMGNWIETQLNRRFRKLMLNKYELDLYFDSVLTDLRDLIDVLGEIGTTDHTVNYDIEELYQDFTPDAEMVNKYLTMLGVKAEDHDALVSVEGICVVTVPIHSKQLNWNVASKTRRTYQIENFPFINRLVRAFTPAMVPMDTRVGTWYMVTADGAVFRFVRSDKPNPTTGVMNVWLVTRM